MSEDIRSHIENPQEPVTPAPQMPRSRGLGRKILRGVGWFAVSLALLVVTLVLGFWWYSTTADFQRRVGSEVVSVLETSTGG